MSVMSGIEVPAGYSTRRPMLDDAEAIVELVTAYSTAIIGVADYTLDDARDDLSTPGFELERDGWLVHDPSGRLSGYAWSNRKADSNEVDIDVVATDPAVCRWLIAQVSARAREAARENGHPEVVLDQGVYRDDKTLRAELESAGFTAATTFHRMRIDHAEHVPTPTAPRGVQLFNVGDDEARRKAAHEVYNAAFAEHFGHVDRPYDTWRETHERRSTFAWTQLWVAVADGRAVGVLECNDQYADDENCGYVAELGVLVAARGRGIAKYLLQHAFAVDSAAGRNGTMLHVDSNNTTPALGLYTSVGMRPVLVIDAWRHTLAV